MSDLLPPLIAFAIIGTLGGLLLFFGWRYLNDWKRKLKVETARTTGIIVDSRKEHRRGYKNAGRDIWIPIIRFTAQVSETAAIEYTLPCSNGVWLESDVHLGAEEEVLYDPRNPESFHLASDTVTERGGASLIRLGIGIIAVGAVTGILLYLE